MISINNLRGKRKFLNVIIRQRGDLEFISPEKEKEEVIQEENSARRKVYEKIGKKIGADPEIVGRRRARQIAVRARRGHYIQDENGKWQRK
jgi:hypothetical protein